ncbi:hypothetical protein GWI33_009398 [Rhynchophorus ferrugineus]|uniref:Uncharacterized protein n=1 Tax=Rhynchophorus ferrugineus TaxID=354439 RepID=A0A834IFJ3_RHYFE|nr:hypothetical protein GWI33_009398 [Rhynchophorus ferrugineus]
MEVAFNLQFKEVTYQCCQLSIDQNVDGVRRPKFSTGTDAAMRMIKPPVLVRPLFTKFVSAPLRSGPRHRREERGKSRERNEKKDSNITSTTNFQSISLRKGEYLVRRLHRS